MSKPESPVMRGLRLQAAQHLCKIEDLLSADYRLTLVARNAKDEEAHICITVESDVSKAIEVLQKLYAEELG